MIKHNTFLKRVKKQFLHINTSIEGYFNKFKYFKSNYKKILSTTNNKVVLGFGIVVILTLTYFLLPTFYSKDLIQSQIKKELSKKYNINIKYYFI